MHNVTNTKTHVKLIRKEKDKSTKTKWMILKKIIRWKHTAHAHSGEDCLNICYI